MADEQTSTVGDNELLTEELLERLLSSTSPEAYLASAVTDDRSLADYLNDLLGARNMTRADLVRASSTNATFLYQVFAGQRKVGRDTAIRLAIGLGCSLRETQRLLRHAGLSELWCKNRRDAIIIYCVEQGFNLMQVDSELYRLGEQTLVPQEG